MSIFVNLDDKVMQAIRRLLKNEYEFDHNKLDDKTTVYNWLQRHGY